jgi:hypothetical protein
MSLSTGIVVLHHGRHDPGRILAEVYDDPQPATGLDVLAIEALPIRDRVQSTMIGSRNRPKDHLHMIE